MKKETKSTYIRLRLAPSEKKIILRAGRTFGGLSRFVRGIVIPMAQAATMPNDDRLEKEREDEWTQ